MKLQLIACAVATAITSSSFADIYQWYDGDGDGSLWLTELDPLPSTNYTNMYLGYADLEGFNLYNSSFYQSDLSYARFNGSYLNDANFRYTYFSNADFTGADVGYADFYNAQGQYSNFLDASLNTTHMLYADFSYSNFQNVFLQSSDVRYAVFEGADFRGADLRTLNGWSIAQWTDAIYDENTQFSTNMNPEELGMIYMPIPAPATLALLSLAGFTIRRRRS